MRIRVRRGDIAKRNAGAIVLAVLEDSKRSSGPLRSVDRVSRGSISALFEREDFRARFLETAVLYPRGLASPRVILVGLGPASELDPRRVLQAGATLARRARDLRVTALVTAAPELESGVAPAWVTQAFCEGLVLGNYRFAAYRRERSPVVRTVEVVTRDAAAGRALEGPVARGLRWAEGTC